MQKLFTTNLHHEQYLQQQLGILRTGNMNVYCRNTKTSTTKCCNKFKYNYKKCNNKMLASHSCFTYQVKPSQLPCRDVQNMPYRSFFLPHFYLCIPEPCANCSTQCTPYIVHKCCVKHFYTPILHLRQM